MSDDLLGRLKRFVSRLTWEGQYTNAGLVQAAIERLLELEGRGKKEEPDAG